MLTGHVLTPMLPSQHNYGTPSLDGTTLGPSEGRSAYSGGKGWKGTIAGNSIRRAANAFPAPSLSDNNERLHGLSNQTGRNHREAWANQDSFDSEHISVLSGPAGIPS